MEEDVLNVVFVGGGHANLLALCDLAARLTPTEVTRWRLTLISNYRHAYYSGMLPGCVSELYTAQEIRFDLPAICEACHVHWVHAKVIGLDREKRLVLVEDGEPIGYDLLSINIGSTTKGSHIPGVTEHALTTRPISEFIPKVEQFEKEHPAWDHPPRIVVVGAGAAGIELCMSLRARFLKKHHMAQVTLVSNTPQPVPSMGYFVISSVMERLKERDIQFKTGYCLKVTENEIWLDDTSKLPFDLLVWATGAEAHPVVLNLDLQLDEDNWIVVEKTLQTKTDKNIFASGDCCTIAGCNWVTKAGVYAVREGPIVAQNLLNLIRKQPLIEYTPQNDFMALLMTGDGQALGSWKGLSWYGQSVWYLKNSIDKAFMLKFNLPSLPYYHAPK